MTESLVRQLQRAGVPCRELSSWVSCREGRRQDCEHCHLDGPSCDEQVVAALVARVVEATGQTDRALEQRDHWRGICNRLCTTVMR
jgi:hypothetical protein